MPEEKKEIKGVAMLSIHFLKSLPETVSSNDELYIWNGKFYEETDSKILQKLIWQFFEENKMLPKLRSATVEEMIKLLKYNSQVKEVELDNYDNLMNLDNCILNLDTMEAYEHSPTVYFSYALDVKYDKKEKAHPIFDKFMQDLFRYRNSEKYDQDTIDLVLSIIAYLIYPKIMMEALFIFLGEGSNGKGVLVEIIKMFFPSKYVTSLSLNIMSNEDSFSRNSLFRSKLNIATEQKVGKKIDSEEIKRISAGESISMRKLYNEPVDFTPMTKILLTPNDFPYFNDNTHGIGRRLFMAEFKNRFEPKIKYDKIKDPAKKGIYLGVQKKELLDSIKKEKSAILNTLLKYLSILKQNNWNLPDTKNTMDLKDEYNSGADVLGTWLEENFITTDGTNGLTVPEIMGDFKEYYETNYPGQRMKYSSVGIGKKIKDKFRIESERIRVDVRDGIGNVMNTSKVTKYPIVRKQFSKVTTVGAEGVEERYEEQERLL